MYMDPTGHYKESDNAELKKIVEPFTQAWNQAKAKNDKAGMEDAERAADAARVSYYGVDSDEKSKKLAKDIKYRYTTFDEFVEQYRTGSAITPSTKDIAVNSALIASNLKAIKYLLESIRNINKGNSVENKVSGKIGESVNSNKGYQSPNGGGGVTSRVKVRDTNVTFGHGGRHLEGTGLPVDKVNNIIANDVSRVNPEVGKFYKGRVKVDGIKIEYTAYGTKKGEINVGTYYPIK